MEFGVVAEAVGEKAKKAVDYILKQNWTKEKKKKYLKRLFKLTGDEFYMRIFEMNSELLNSTALKSLGYDNPEDQIERLSEKVIQNYNLTRSNESLTKEFYYTVMADAQIVAFRNARSLGQHPTITRKINGETCKWCISMAGTYIDPDYEVFRHHENCNCSFILRGFGDRTGRYRGHVPNRYEDPEEWKEKRFSNLRKAMS